MMVTAVPSPRRRLTAPSVPSAVAASTDDGSCRASWICDVCHEPVAAPDARIGATVLGFHRAGSHATADRTRRKAFLQHDQLDVRLGLCQHASTTGRSFDETQPGSTTSASPSAV